MPARRDPAEFPNALLMQSCDIPEGMTIAEWRAWKRAAAQAAPRRRRRLGRRRARQQ
jgi:hypothetical protein